MEIQLDDELDQEQWDELFTRVIVAWEDDHGVPDRGQHTRQEDGHIRHTAAYSLPARGGRLQVDIETTIPDGYEDAALSYQADAALLTPGGDIRDAEVPGDLQEIATRQATYL